MHLGYTFFCQYVCSLGIKRLNQTLTVLVHAELVDGVDVAQRGDARLDLGASLARDLMNALDHLLLPVDPVQEVPEHRQPHRLQDVGVLDHDTIGSWRTDRALITNEVTF